MTHICVSKQTVIGSDNGLAPAWLVGDKPLSEPMMEYCQMDAGEQTSVKYKLQFKHFHLRKCV